MLFEVRPESVLDTTAAAVPNLTVKARTSVTTLFLLKLSVETIISYPIESLLVTSLFELEKVTEFVLEQQQHTYLST